MKKYIIGVSFITALSSCVQKEYQKNITFLVDMNGVEKVNSVGIRGSFFPNKWKKTVAMTDENNDGIYELSFSKETAISSIEFKFIKNNTEFELEGKDNRKIVFKYKPETITYKATFNNNSKTGVQ